MSRFLLAVTLCAWVGLPCRAAEKKTIDLGGLRRVQAEVQVEGDDYVVRTRMLPVSCFDAATNARLNRDKAELYSLQGLARYLSRAKDTHLDVSGARVTATGRAGKFYTLVLRVPRAGVKVVRAGPGRPVAPPAKAVRRLAFTDSFFTRKRDYLHTLERLAAGLAADLRGAERRAAEAEKGREGFPLAVAELEERGEDNFKKLRAEVSADKLLLTVEKDEVLGDLGRRRARWLKSLGDAVRRHEALESEKPA
jgi:hypothetical protein